MFVKEDIPKLRALKVLISKSKLELTGDAVILAASLIQWFNQLEKRAEEFLSKPLKIKEVKPPMKKIGK